MMNEMAFDVKRLGCIISQAELPGEDGDNINGPCCIEVPEWCENKLGKYYLYFTHHKGKYIRMAYSDSIEHGWKIHAGGVLNLDEYTDAHHHAASPDILIDHDNKEIRLYFHAPSTIKKEEQWSYAASAVDGLTFRKLSDEPLAPFYMRVFQWGEHIYGMTKGGNLWRSKSGASPFEQGPNPFDPSLSDEIWHNTDGSIRHLALSESNGTMRIFYTCIGDAPERIYCSSMDLSEPNWMNWRVHDKTEIMRPVEDYEGVGISLTKSKGGAAKKPEHALRDPDILTVGGGDTYLFYSVMGEQGIAVAQIASIP
jgi:hypothetical protein